MTDGFFQNQIARVFSSSFEREDQCGVAILRNGTVGAVS